MMVIIGFHLYHGVWSLFQTLGLDNPDRNALLRAFAMVFAIGVSATFCLIPLSFMFGGDVGVDSEGMNRIYEYSHDKLSNH